MRPSGVVSAANEPIPGWVDAYLLVEPLIEGVGRGQITNFPGDPNCVMDLVPVDYVCNVILAAATALPSGSSTELTPGKQVRIYQCASGDVCPTTLGEIEATWRDYFKHAPFADAKGNAIKIKPVEFASDAEAFANSMRRKYVGPLRLLTQAVEVVPHWEHVGALRSARGWLERKRRGLERVLGLSGLYSTYTLNAWSFKTGNTRSLMTSLSEEDQSVYPYFQSASGQAKQPSWDWGDFWCQLHIPGMRRWVLKEASLPQSKL